MLARPRHLWQPTGRTKGWSARPFVWKCLNVPFAKESVTVSAGRSYEASADQVAAPTMSRRGNPGFGPSLGRA